MGSFIIFREDSGSDSDEDELAISSGGCIRVDDSLSVKCIALKSDSSESCIQVKADTPYVNITPNTKPTAPTTPTDPSTRPELSITTINGEVPEENVNYDPVGDIYYVKDHDVLILTIDNYDPSATYLDMGAETDHVHGALYDNKDGTLIWAVGDNPDGWDRLFWIRCQEPDKDVSEYGYTYVTTMEQSGQPILTYDSLVKPPDDINILIDNYDGENKYVANMYYNNTFSGQYSYANVNVTSNVINIPAPIMRVIVYFEISAIEPYKYKSHTVLISITIGGAWKGSDEYKIYIMTMTVSYGGDDYNFRTESINEWQSAHPISVYSGTLQGDGTGVCTHITGFFTDDPKYTVNPKYRVNTAGKLCDNSTACCKDTVSGGFGCTVYALHPTT